MNTPQVLETREQLRLILKLQSRREVSPEAAVKMLMEQVYHAYNQGVSIGLGSAMQNARPKPRTHTPAFYHRR